MSEAKRVAVINLSHPHYNLDAEKLSAWLTDTGWTVQRFTCDPGLFLQGFDLVCISAIFTWDLLAGPGLFEERVFWRGVEGHAGTDKLASDESAGACVSK